MSGYPGRSALSVPILDTTFEPHYSIGELARQWKLGRETVRLLVKNEPGVLKIRMGLRKAMTGTVFRNRWPGACTLDCLIQRHRTSTVSGRDVLDSIGIYVERDCANMIEAEGFEAVATLISIGEKERARRERALGDTIANLRIENLHLDDESRRIFQRHVDGEIGLEEFRAAIDELNERRFGPLSVSRNGRS
jgi:hypothetical protein